MARQKGIIKIEGNIGEYSFYQTKDGFIARQKGGVSGDRIKSDPKFRRTRENGKEFGASGIAGKMLRDAIRPLMINATDTKVVSRLTQVMSVIKNLDGTSARGFRNVGTGISAAGAKELLKDFDFNIEATLRSKLLKAFDVTPATGAISIKQFIPEREIKFPEGASHLALTGGWARVDFVSGASEVFQSNVVNLPIDNTAGDVSLIPNGLPNGPGTNFFLLKIEFYQEINGVQYSLQNGSFNVLSIVGVA